MTRIVGRSRDANLLPLFRSDAQARILATIFLAPDDVPTHVRAVAARTGLPYSTVQREISRLEDARLVESRVIGRSKVVRPNPSSPYFEELTSLLLKSYGPATVLGAVLRGRGGVREAYIYGSWAARYLGDPGHDPRDIDVVVVVDRTADRFAIEDALASAGEQLGRQVNPVLVAEQDWDEAASPFIRTIRSRPVVGVETSGDDDVDR